VLPDSFWTPNAHGVRGGIEAAFMSTTFDRQVAMHYASQPGKPSLVLEMTMGMIDRGAEISWLSQYPFERECLFNPLTGLEVQRSRIEGSVLVVEARLSVNLNALTIEQVVSKRRKMLLDLAAAAPVELRDALAASSDWRAHASEQAVRVAMAEEMLVNIAMSQEAEWYNDDANFAKAVGIALKVKQALADSPTELDLRGASMLTALPSRLGDCKALTDLSLPWCANLTALPETIGDCRRLERLDLDCTAITALPARLAECEALEEISLHGCAALVALPDLSRLPMLVVKDLPEDLEPWQDGGLQAWQRETT
jgi:hypothetical protein